MWVKYLDNPKVMTGVFGEQNRTALTAPCKSVHCGN